MNEHKDNGAGYCRGCPIEKNPRWPNGDGRLTVKTRYCPVINTPEQLATHAMEDREFAINKATARVAAATSELMFAENALVELLSSK